MNYLQEVIKNINGQDYPTRFIKLKETGKINVLYFSAYLNGVGLYRAVIPSLELNKTTTHAAIVLSLEPFTQENMAKGLTLAFNEEIIQWADYIVFQTSFHDLQQTIDVLKSINTKPHLKFCMDIDDNYHVEQEGEDPVFAKKMRDQLLKNMMACDIIIAENNNLRHAYTQNLKELCPPSLKGAGGWGQGDVPSFAIMPNFMSDTCYTGIKKLPHNSDKINIGMIFNPTQFNDVTMIRQDLLQINRQYKNKVELTLFGWNCKIPGRFLKNALIGVHYNYVPPVPITRYFETLHNLHFDIALMPLKDNKFNRCKSHHKLLQYAQLGIPVICSEVEPYTNAAGIKPFSTIDPTTERWHTYISHCIERPKTRTAYAEKNKQAITENYTWNTNIPILQAIFNRE